MTAKEALAFLNEAEWKKIDKYVNEGYTYPEIHRALTHYYRRRGRKFFSSAEYFRNKHKKRLAEQEALRPKYRLPI